MAIASSSSKPGSEKDLMDLSHLPLLQKRMSCWWLLNPTQFWKNMRKSSILWVGVKIKKIFGKHHPDVILYSCIVQVKPSSWCCFEKLHGCRVTLRTALPCFVRYKPKVLKPWWRFGDRKEIHESEAIQRCPKTKHPTNIDPTVAYKNGHKVSGNYFGNIGWIMVYLYIFGNFNVHWVQRSWKKPICHPQKTKPALGSGSS